MGKSKAANPISGRNEITMNTLRNPTASAAEPKSAVAMPPIPKLTPKKTPEIKPTCVGAALSAQTRMAEKADDMMNYTARAKKTNI